MAFLAAIPAKATASMNFEQRAMLSAANGIPADIGEPQPGAGVSAQEIKEGMSGGWEKAIKAARVNPHKFLLYASVLTDSRWS